MTDHTDPSSEPTPQRRRIWPYLLIPAALGFAFFLTWRIVNEPRGSQGSPQVVLSPVEQPPLPDGGHTLSVDEGDRHLKEAAAAWSSDPLFAQWLELLSLRHLVAAAQLLADGDNVKPALPFVTIPGEFKAREVRPRPAQERLFIAPAVPTRARAVDPSHARHGVPRVTRAGRPRSAA